MEFIFNKNTFQSGVSIVERIVSTKSTLPIIGNILIEAEKSGVKLSANNLEMGIEIKIPAKIVKEGSILIPAKTLSGIVSKLPDSDVNFKLKEKGVIAISYKKSNFNIHGLPADEFPQLPRIKENKTIKIDKKIFQRMIEQTIFSSSSSEEKFVLNGILFETGKTDGSNVRMVATDGYRLAKIGETIDGVDINVSAIIPSKALSELLKIINAEKEGNVTINISSDQAAFNFNNVYLVTRLIQGQFPDYKQVIPKMLEIKIFANTKMLLQSSERAAVIASQSANIVKIEVRGGQLYISAQAPDVGSVEEVLDVEVKGKEKAAAAFNIRLLTDALKVIEEEFIVLELGAPLSPGMIKPKDGPDFTYIVMPIRTQEVSA
ncbi:MAG: DNA polymerase III subunit beta [Candidatus Saganbacteria bacterium]|uniref:Beta sliding clamp n=1 Tax=Candidatus Saganbacteria bacterium TaxID=2575572 RepID=A0A833L1Z9_UNCSA|nr:MAG: DNA polymerase III subunit beta [Candidatus Saganbacteria bacterium]